MQLFKSEWVFEPMRTPGTFDLRRPRFALRYGVGARRCAPCARPCRRSTRRRHWQRSSASVTCCAGSPSTTARPDALRRPRQCGRRRRATRQRASVASAALNVALGRIASASLAMSGW
jgi:hypothetical protein